MDLSYSPNYSWPQSFSSLPGTSTTVGLSWNLPKLGYSRCAQRFSCWSVALKRILVDVTTKMGASSSESHRYDERRSQRTEKLDASCLCTSLTSLICNLFHPFWLFCSSCVVRLCSPWCGPQCTRTQMPPSTARGKRKHLHQRRLLFSNKTDTKNDISLLLMWHGRFRGWDRHYKHAL